MNSSTALLFVDLGLDLHQVQGTKRGRPPHNKHARLFRALLFLGLSLSFLGAVATPPAPASAAPSGR